jgi:hypothetical protein
LLHGSSARTRPRHAKTYSPNSSDATPVIYRHYARRVALRLKTRPLRSNHSFRATKSTKESKARRRGLAIRLPSRTHQLQGLSRRRGGRDPNQDFAASAPRPSCYKHNRATCGIWTPHAVNIKRTQVASAASPWRWQRYDVQQ